LSETAGEILLRVSHLSVAFRSPSGRVRAVDDISFDVRRGETLAIVGESGSGKSVTFMASLGLLAADNLERVDGEVLFEGRDLLRMTTAERRRVLGGEIGMVFQDPMSALNPVQRVGQQIAESLRLHDKGLSGAAARKKAVELLDLVGLPQPEVRARQFPHQFSGGMCQRAMIAMAIANRPKLLIADEPTTAVDVSVQAQLLEVLRVAQQETGAATVLITHDMGVVAQTADRMCVLYAGRIAETGSVPEVFGAPEHPYTAGLIDCIPQLTGPVGRLRPIAGQPPDLSAVPPGCAFAPRCRVGAGHAECTTQRPALTAGAGDARLRACHFPLTTLSPPPFGTSEDGTGDQIQPPDRGTGGDLRGVGPHAEAPRVDEARVGEPHVGERKVLLQVENLVKHYPVKSGAFGSSRQRVHAVDDISFTVYEGETLGLVGESGCGKSTTARALLRLDEPTSGRVLFEGADIAAAGRSDLRRIRQRMQMVFQHPRASLNPRLTAGDNVAEPLRIAGSYPRDKRRKRVLELFDRVGLRPEHATRLPADFSGGQQQRIAIARALSLNPRLVILDEPVSALDVSVQAQVLNLLGDLQADLGLTYVFVSHDLSVVRHISDRVAVMYLGKIVESGSRDQVFQAARHPYTRALLSSVPSPDPTDRNPDRALALRGEVPAPTDPPSGCRFRTRCPRAQERCALEEPALAPYADDGTGLVACHFPVIGPVVGDRNGTDGSVVSAR
jgi:peptide/nickel transport system ATP-binding protein